MKSCHSMHVEVKDFQEPVLSFHHVSAENQTQVIRCGGKYLYPMSHLTGPIHFILAVLYLDY